MNYDLLQLNSLVQRAVQVALPATYWLTAEIASWSVRGHAYGELVQKDDVGRTVASARCNCWQSTYYAVKQKFFLATGGELKSGMQVLLQVKPTFHPQYGFAYNIQDIDPTYTMGDAARRRKEILSALQREGLMRMNEQNNPLPALLQRIAVVSSPTAAGYGDFCHQLLRNGEAPSQPPPTGGGEKKLPRLRFIPTLFPAVMQGDGVEESVMAAFDAIAKRQDEFDCVVIIRGGGAVTDLDCFDNYRLAEAVALFPLPVFTGIGHERDEVVLDFVAHTRLKTPTAVAAFLIDHNARQLDLLATLSKTFAHAPRLMIERQYGRLSQYVLRYEGAHRVSMQRQRSRIELLQQKITMLDPKRVLERGYSMTISDGLLVTDASQLSTGDELITITANGTARSVVV